MGAVIWRAGRRPTRNLVTEGDCELPASYRPTRRGIWPTDMRDHGDVHTFDDVRRAGRQERAEHRTRYSEERNVLDFLR